MQLYCEYLVVPADGISAAKLARAETSVCLRFMGSSQTSHRLPVRPIWVLPRQITSHAGCADRAASVTRAAEGRPEGSCVGLGSAESGEITYWGLAVPSCSEPQLQPPLSPAGVLLTVRSFHQQRDAGLHIPPRLLCLPAPGLASRSEEHTSELQS